MQFHIAGTTADFHVMSTHTAGPDDTTPLQMISAARLAELERIEAAARALAGAVPATPEPVPDGITAA